MRTVISPADTDDADRASPLDRKPSVPGRTGRRVLPAVGMACIVSLLIFVAIAAAGALGPGLQTPRIVDFRFFHLVGGLALEGRLAEAYDWPRLEAMENSIGSGTANFMPFAYPPPFALITALLAMLPIQAAFLVFVAVGSVLLAWALRRAGGDWFWPVFAAMSPTIAVNIAIGQNGMLVAGIAGLACILLLEGRDRAAGATAAVLFVLKPQVCSTFPALFVTGRRWPAALAAAAAAATLFAAAEVLLGAGTTRAFVSALIGSAHALSDGRIPLYRITSVFGALRSVGVEPTGAIAIHVGCAVLALGAAARTAAGEDCRVRCGLTLMTTAFVSPYFHDYDLPVMGLGLAFVLPRMARRGEPRAWRAVVPLLALALAESVGPIEALSLDTRVSAGAPFVLICLMSTLLALKASAPNSAGAAI